ncbi:MAG: DUF5615 family PIN-like protein [Bacteroidota bacterium]
MRLYANENFPNRVVAVLRAFGHDVLTTKDRSQANLGVPDEEVFSFAQADGRAILTTNRRDFFKLHRLNPLHPGIIACTEDHDFEGLAKRIDQTIQALDGKLENQLVRIYRPNPSQKFGGS